MGLNDAPSAERVHIGFFGRRNAGKSSLVNAVTGQDLSVVSPERGTTTDPVRKSMEILPLGPVVIIDTPGFDDEGPLGERRVRAARRTLDQTDVAVLVVDATAGMGDCERRLQELFRSHDVPYLVALTKRDLLPRVPADDDARVYVSGLTGEGVGALRERVARLGSAGARERPLVRDLIAPGDLVVLVIPLDKAAPKGRLILPEQMMIRDVLEAGAVSMVVRDSELAAVLGRMPPPARPTLVITDSQAFSQVAAIVPADVPLTSFSILMARRKGLLAGAVRGVAAIDRLRDGDRVLVAEGCTHHRQCGDIGTVKIPAWLRERTGKRLMVDATSGHGFPDDLTPYRLVLHCGGCMLNGRELARRAAACAAQEVPLTNYGTAIAHMKGILARSLSLFPDLVRLLEEDGQEPDGPKPGGRGDGTIVRGRP
ncbi:[FeFe] hydrogenase H-cluster maturation GTPase HydF [Olsenella sp. HMSC062G07]|uniref:[FeFe] hydrogenase H-cluster maturation GTPase HydF n=1 Tax=Olsenella sp. HMSC062G07 TaxID=1739330 RepID=UPI0008A659D0|nr:[FeFe] hydrogenase H-cluster maturation GTPase HydF [Olsenella sp. HMSC062G07]